MSLLYNCHRSATVVSNNYTTLAVLNPISFREVAFKCASYVQHLKDQVFLYDDPCKSFLTTYLKKVPYMWSLSQDTFHDVLFNFKQSTFEKGSYIFRERERSTGFFIVKNGILELSVTVEGEEIAIERLYRGSMINSMAFLTCETCHANAKCG